MLGIFLMRRYAHLMRRLSPDIMAFAAGLITGGAFLHFIPELSARAVGFIPYMTLSFFGLYVFQHHFAPHFHATPAEEEQIRHMILGIMVGIAFAVHAAFDGMTLGAGMAHSARLGSVSILAVIGHKLPEGIVTYTLFTYSGYSEKRAFAYATVIAWITPVVAWGVYVLAHVLPSAFLDINLALATGVLLYIGASDLLPEVAHFPGWRKTFFVLIGVLFTWGLRVFFHA